MVGDDQIKQWKEQYGKVYRYRAEDGKIAYFKPPALQTLDAAKAVSGKSTMKFNQVILANCWLGGDNDIKTQEPYLIGLYEWLPSIIHKIAGEMEEL